MYKILIVLNCTQTNFQFSYKTLVSAEEAYNSVVESNGESVAALQDDYGHKAFISRGSIAGILFTDFHEEMDGVILQKLMETRAQRKLDNQLRNDPTLKLATAGGIQ